MEETLSCKETEKQIPMFLNKTLSENETLALIEHINNCKSCKEELTIQYMVSVGLNNLDEIIDLNVDKELEKRKKEALRSLYKKDIIERGYLGIFFVGVTIFCLAALLIIL